ncbi:hypothetical protein GUJ93_ZPchr0001g31269 [Zizania palustris]|uniref:Uncharacterized protein n=1 Tax=Zizania palustris TaxID=103762 RepID=A0A8J5RZT6_ZIZPA|nr:hypothetical protein GUJ93_ZPchr0001g31269 [Zizania palustris]
MVGEAHGGGAEVAAALSSFSSACRVGLHGARRRREAGEAGGGGGKAWRRRRLGSVEVAAGKRRSAW